MRLFRLGRIPDLRLLHDRVDARAMDAEHVRIGSRSIIT
jgi:hypothetical protein